ncbi:MULTIHEME_CYTC domain-containing protein [Nitrospira tepida]|uniref:MULTIHEME_CYTC domain-containing protein n=1 Tax=Nitrospira tepida TaxID=2973512 RepID=A0AA86T9N5_9BACT|nr:multiheme c-type cytochrome [Nitrospira tepida]CAI4032868.1 MULTIHEME_CYTC domain-containing protein [Nitrospira tepida]
MTRWMKIALAGLGLAGLAYFYYTEIKPVVIFGLRDDYARAIPYQAVPAGLDSLKAESCGTCHREIYEEWKSSIHAQAYDDPFFQAYWAKDKHIWVCLNCHTPLENQQPTLIKEIPRGRVERAVQEVNPRFDPDYQKEAITCAACHVRDGVIHGPYEDSAAPHPTKFDPSFRTAQICYRCHNVVSGPAQFYNVGPCGTYAEYEGKYFMQERGFICQSCHMPEVDRPVADGSPIRRGRRHLWRGGHDPDMIKRAVAVEVTAEPRRPKPGDNVTFTLTLVNAGAGHKIPTGDPDRHFTVEFDVEDASGRVVAHQQDTMGRWILWQPAILELYDNRLLPLASRDYRFRQKFPGGAERLTVKARVRYHILTDGQHEMLTKKYGLTADDPYSFVIYERAFPLTDDLPGLLQAASGSDTQACRADGKAAG